MHYLYFICLNSGFPLMSAKIHLCRSTPSCLQEASETAGKHFRVYQVNLNWSPEEATSHQPCRLSLTRLAGLIPLGRTHWSSVPPVSSPPPVHKAASVVLCLCAEEGLFHLQHPCHSSSDHGSSTSRSSRPENLQLHAWKVTFWGGWNLDGGWTVFD